MTKKRKLVTAIATVLVVILGLLALAATAKKLPTFATRLIACGALPNNSIQNIVETTRLFIKLPKYTYLQQEDRPLLFKSVNGTAQPHWISNAGPMGKSYGSSSGCSSYYYEFDGTGEVDLSIHGSNQGTPNYLIRFIIHSNVADRSNLYQNNQYGFTFKLPESWKGYSVLTQKWSGSTSGGSSGDFTKESGALIILRNPHWTVLKMRQDIPIMVFTLSQWSALKAQKFYVSAAPIPPSELGRNTQYLFALPPRYNYAFPAGWQEVEKILEGKPFLVSSS